MGDRRVKRTSISAQTRINWLIDAFVFGTGVLAALTGIYFLYFISGGYQGGRNPTYGTVLLFERRTWDDLHVWGGVLMIVAALIHLVYHWPWVVTMVRRALTFRPSRRPHMSSGAKVNIGVDAVLAASFILAAISGVVLLFSPAGGLQGGANPGWEATLLVSRSTWDSIHTWSGVFAVIAAMIHFVIHWGWIRKVTSRFFLSLGNWGLRPETHSRYSGRLSKQAPHHSS
jgi:hypothetical protein